MPALLFSQTLRVVGTVSKKDPVTTVVMPRKVRRRVSLSVQTVGPAAAAIIAFDAGTLRDVKVVNGIVQGSGNFYVITTNSVPQAFVVGPDEVLYAVATEPNVRMNTGTWVIPPGMAAEGDEIAQLEQEYP